jgi:hypothetical protein
VTASGADLPTPELPAPEPSAPRTVASPGPQAVARIVDVGLRVLAGVVATLLAVLLALAEGFLLPTRIVDIPAPVASFVLVVAGNAALIRFAYHATGSGLGMVGPCVAWLGTMLVLGSRTDEGDLVLPGDWRALLLFFGGTAVLVVAAFLAVTPSPARIRGGAAERP